MKNWILWTIVGIGLFLRLWGIAYGLPGSFIPDESLIANKAAAMGTGDLNPHFFGYPTFFMYLTALSYGLLFAVLKFIGLITSIPDFKTVFFAQPSAFYLIPRVISVMFGTALIWVTYEIGRNIYSKRAGLLAALLLSLCPLSVTTSKFDFINTPQTFWIALSMYFLCLLYDAVPEKSPKYYILAGAALGLGISTKYSAVYAVPAFLFVHFAKFKSGIFRQPKLTAGPVSAVLATLMAFFITSPYFFLDFNTFTLYFNIAAPRLTSSLFDVPQIKLVISSTVEKLWHGTGPALMFLSLSGMALAAFRRNAKEGILLVFAASYLFLFILRISFPHVPQRYLDPLPFIMCLFSAGFIRTVYAKFGKRFFTTTLGILVAAMIMFNISGIIRDSVLLCRQDTRLAAKAWIESNIPGESKIAVYGMSYYYPPIHESRKLMKTKLDFVNTLGAMRNGNFSDIFAGPRSYAMKLEQPAQQPGYCVYDVSDKLEDIEIPKLWMIKSSQKPAGLKSMGIRYVAILSHPVKPMTGAGASFENDLRRTARLEAEFEPLKPGAAASGDALKYDLDANLQPISGHALLKNRGPRIRIYRL